MGFPMGDTGIHNKNQAFSLAQENKNHGNMAKYGYPLVNIQKVIENGHRKRGFTH